MERPEERREAGDPSPLGLSSSPSAAFPLGTALPGTVSESVLFKLEGLLAEPLALALRGGDWPPGWSNSFVDLVVSRFHLLLGSGLVSSACSIEAGGLVGAGALVGVGSALPEDEAFVPSVLIRGFFASLLASPFLLSF